jgi:hypothetical protein
MSNPTVASNPSPFRPRRRRKLAWIGGILLVLSGLVVGAYFYAGYSARKELAEAIADTDRSDPHWRLEDIEAGRRVVPDDQNSALLVHAVHQLAMGSMPEVGNVPPQVQLSVPSLAVLKAEQQKVASALERARQLKDRPWGRFAVDWSAGNTPIANEDYIQECREVAHLLVADAALRAQENDLDGAVDLCRALINDARALGDEPSQISGLVRIAITAIGLSAIERTLAQREPSEPAVAGLQQLLEQEDREPLLLTMVRGERALCDRTMQLLEEGTSNSGRLPTLDLGKIGRLGVGSVTINRIVATALAGSVPRGHASLLRYYNRLVEIARLPEPQQREPLVALEQELRAQIAEPLNLRMAFVRMLAPAMLKIREALLRHHAKLRSTYVALAAERYRRQHGRWPDTLEQLVPGLLGRIPLDPYDGRPIRYRRLEDGVVVYSVGLDGQDNGGKLLANVMSPGADIGFRLWDVKARRQPVESAGK